MHWIRSNGKLLTVRAVGPVIYQLAARRDDVPLPIRDEIMDDQEARAFISKLLAMGRYKERGFR